MPAVRYLVGDVEQAIAFYLSLGFSVKERMGPPFAMVERDGLVLWLSGPGSSAARPLADGSQPSPGAGWNRLVVVVDDINGALDAARAAGATVRNEPITGPGGTQALLADPFGNLVELFLPA